LSILPRCVFPKMAATPAIEECGFPATCDGFHDQERGRLTRRLNVFLAIAEMVTFPAT